MQGFSYSLKESLETVAVNDYIVYEGARLYTVIHVRGKSQTHVVFDEIVISTDCLKSLQLTFSEWIKEKAPNNASWMSYEVDLKNAQVVKSYSRTKRTNQDVKEGCFLTTLLRLQCEEEPASWTAPLPNHFEGPTKRWTGHWPHDGSLLADANVICFTGKEAFPYWIEVRKERKRFLLRAVANGHVVDNQTKS